MKYQTVCPSCGSEVNEEILTDIHGNYYVVCKKIVWHEKDNHTQHDMLHDCCNTYIKITVENNKK